VLGAIALGGAVAIPDKVNRNFSGVYELPAQQLT
jgi:hypothetical protein